MKNQTCYVLLLPALILLMGCNKQQIQQLESQLAAKTEQVEQLEEQIVHLQDANASQLELMSDLSVLSKTEAESVRQSLDNISAQYSFIQDLTQKVHEKDSVNLALVMNLKRSLGDLNNDDIKVEVRGGKVHVSISDKMLFASGSSKLNDEAQRVLSNLAQVLNDHSDLDVMVEGHTDNVPIAQSCVKDNWDLSVRRATAVVRDLQDNHYVDPQRLVAAGRSEYMPIADNDYEEGRSVNRRTEIVITPRLDQFFKLLEGPVLAD